MTFELSLRCRCGSVSARAVQVSPATTNHVVCYCKDCRAFARWLERTDVLDAGGGTDIVQMARVRVVFNQGLHHVACVRLSEKGLFRWYASCCRTPIGNTLTRAPFIGVISAFFDPAEPERHGIALGRAVPIQTRQATGPVPDDSPAAFPMYLHVTRLLLGWSIRGLGATPLFDPHTRAPRVAPRVLTKAERDALRD